MPRTSAARAGTAVRHWASQSAAPLLFHPDRLLYVVLHGKPDSLAERRDYAKSRTWIPEELKGTTAEKVLTFLGVAFHVLITPVKAVIKAADAATDRPLRTAGLFILVIVLLFIVF